MSTSQRPLPPDLAEIAVALGLRNEVVIYNTELVGAIFPAATDRPPHVTAVGADVDAAFAAVCRKLSSYARTTSEAKRQRANAARRIADDAEHDARAIEDALAAFDAASGTPTRRYRTVLFLADPFTGAQFPVGALVETQGVVRFIEAPRMPDATYLGETSFLLAFVLRSLRALDTMRPRSISPQVRIEGARTIPPDVDVDEWITTYLAGGKRTVMPSGADVTQDAPA